MTDPTDARHLSYANLELLWDAAVPLVVPVPGTPSCELRLEPGEQRITLVTDHQVPEPDVAALKNVSYKPRVADERDVAEISVHVDNDLHGAYGLLAAVADELQLAGTPVAAAVRVSINRFRNVFAKRAALTPQEEIGLYGELLCLEFLIDAIGPEATTAAWQGPWSEEHDFVFDSFLAEVKATVAERRRHTVSGLTQLVPGGGVPLHVVSVQVTRANAGSGRTLPALVAGARAASAGFVAVLDQKLDLIGWDTDDADLYVTAWTLRSTPRAYEVKGDFPAVTPDRIGPVIPNFALVSDVSYRIDLTDLPNTALPHPLTAFVEEPRS